MSKSEPLPIESTYDSITTRYGCYIAVNDEQLSTLGRASLTAEVVLDYNGQTRTCTFEELVAFMKGEGK